MKRLALALSAACLAAPALAADLPSRYAPPAPYYDPLPVFTWTGLYAGLNIEGGIGSFTGGPPFGTPVGGAGGGTIGYNYQQGKLLVGAEADLDYGYIGGTGGAGLLVGGGAIHPIGTARVRVGYIFADRALVYLTGGYAGTSLDGHVADFLNAPNVLVGESHYLNGFAIGVGAEYAITTKISVKAEYLYTSFASTGYFSGTPDARSIGANVHLLRVGVNYHF